MATQEIELSGEIVVLHEGDTYTIQSEAMEGSSGEHATIDTDGDFAIVDLSIVGALNLEYVDIDNVHVVGGTITTTGTIGAGCLGVFAPDFAASATPKIMRNTDSVGYTPDSGYGTKTGYFPWLVADLSQLTGVTVIDNTINGENYQNSQNLSAVLAARIATFGMGEGDIAIAGAAIWDVWSYVSNSGLTDEQTRQYYTTIFDIFSANKIKVYWCLGTSFDDTLTGPNRTNAKMQAKNAIAVELAAKYCNVTVIDLYTPSLTLNKPDGTHEDHAGFEALARIVAARLQQDFGDTTDATRPTKYEDCTQWVRITFKNANCHLSDDNTVLWINETGFSRIFTTAKSDAKDVVATLADGTKLDIYKASYDTTGKTLSFAIKIPELSFVKDRNIFLQWGSDTVDEASATTTFTNYLNFWAGNNNLVDSINGDDLTVEQGSVGYAAGKIGDVFSLGASAYLSAPANDRYATAQNTFLCWYKIPSLAAMPSGYGGLISCYRALNNRGMMLSIYGDGKIYGRTGDGTSPYELASVAGIAADNVWGLAAITYDGVTARLLHNTSEVAQRTNVRAFNAGVNMVIGRSFWDADAYYVGNGALIGGIRILDYAITEDQAGTIYEIERQYYENGVVEVSENGPSSGGQSGFMQGIGRPIVGAGVFAGRRLSGESGLRG